MSCRPRQFRHGETYFVSNRTARGLPFVANVFMNMILGGVLARAQQLYSGVELGAGIFMGNHYHLILTLTGCAESMKCFMNYVDAEIAKCINRLTGISSQNVWAGKYEARALLTVDAVIEKFIYLFCNPAKANLVDSIDDYPGLNTWRQFCGKEKIAFKWIKSSELTKLPRQGFTTSILRERLRELDSVERDSNELVVNPFAWMAYMPDAKGLTTEQFVARVKNEVRAREASFQKERREKKKGIVTAQALSSQSIYKLYRPKAWTKSAACISTCKELAKSYIQTYRDFCSACRRAWLEWKRGNLAAKYPPGAFLPSRPPLSCILT